MRRCLKRLVHRYPVFFLTELASVNQLPAVQPSDGLDANPFAVANSNAFNLDGFLARLNIRYTHDTYDGGDRYKLNHCPFNSEHGKGEVAIFRVADGQLGFKCLHDSCQDKTWQDLQALVDGPPEKRTKAASDKQSQSTQLLEQVETILLFQNADGAYAIISVNGHSETWPLSNMQFRNYLTRQYYLLYRRAPGGRRILHCYRLHAPLFGPTHYKIRHS